MLDRRGTAPYLNIMEKVNCLYCGYLNGLTAYAQEIGGRREQYWCPHQARPKVDDAAQTGMPNSRVWRPARDTGDQIETVRRDFEDLKWTLFP